MNIANGTGATISLQSLTKKTDGKGKTEAYVGKVIAKSGKEIQVLINDKVYKIEPGNSQNIKIGDKIQVFFGKNLPSEISEEMLKKISGKLIDVFSLSLPYKTTQELEDLINQMPQKERLQFAEISNDIVNLTKTILKEDFNLNSVDISETNKESVEIFNPKLPFNRRLIELSLKAKEMGKAWEQIPTDVKKQIIKEFVLYDLKITKKEPTKEMYEPFQNKFSSIVKDNPESQKLDRQQTNQLQNKSDFSNIISNNGTQNKEIILKREKQVNAQIPHQNKQKQYETGQKENKTIIKENIQQVLKTTNKELPNIEKISKSIPSMDNTTTSKELPVIKTFDEFKQTSNGMENIDDGKDLKKIFFSLPVIKKDEFPLDMSPKKPQVDVKTLKLWLNAFISKVTKNVEQKQMVSTTTFQPKKTKTQSEVKSVDNIITYKKKESYMNNTQNKTQKNDIPSDISKNEVAHTKLKITNNQNRQLIILDFKKLTIDEMAVNRQIGDSIKKTETDFPQNKNYMSTIHTDKLKNLEQSSFNPQKTVVIKNSINSAATLKGIMTKEFIREVETILQNTLSKPITFERNLEGLEKINQSQKSESNEFINLVEKIKQTNLLTDSDNILSLIKKIITSSDNFENPLFTNKANHSMSSVDVSQDFTFNKIIKTPLMDLEIKNTTAQFKSLGIEPKDALKTVYDIANIAYRSVKEENIDSHLFPIALKRYLKLKLPQLIFNNDISQSKEKNLISKVENFSKKAFILIKNYADKFKANNEMQSNQPSEKALEQKNLTKQEITNAKQMNISDNQLSEKVKTTGKGILNEPEAPPTTQKQKPQFTADIHRNNEAKVNDKEEMLLNQSKAKEVIDNTIQSEKRVHLEPKQGDQLQKSEISSAKFIKFLNISSDKTDFSNAYSSLISLNKQPFAIDFQHQKTDKGGYEKSDMYRVFIETNTQIFGTVFIDTVVSDKKIDIYIYAEEQYAKEFTNNSSTLIQRIKETNYNLTGLFIREKLDQNGILKHKVKRFTDSQNKGGFFRFA